MNAYTGSSGRERHRSSSSHTLSVMAETVSALIEKPYISRTVAAMSRCDMPRAYIDITRDSMPVRSRSPLGTTAGSKVASRSRGTSMGTSPALVRTTLRG